MREDSSHRGGQGEGPGGPRLSRRAMRPAPTRSRARRQRLDSPRTRARRPLAGEQSHHLPVQSTPLIGRQQELAAVRQALLRTDVRLLTLVGPAGIGKTRLALEVAASLREEVGPRTLFVDLAPISDPALVVSTIAQTLGVSEERDQPLFERLKHWLRHKQLLLVLDNFEQVVTAASEVAELLAACSKVKILVTSRAPLHLSWEHEFPVPPLGLPSRDRLPALDALVNYAAVALFIERAAAVKPDFALTRHNARAVAEICIRLDGLPLAIELAAARIKLLSPQAMLERLDRGLALLTGGARDLPTRHQTLRGAIAWSYDLLEANEQALFRRLAAFVGGCTLESAETLCNGEGGFRTDVLEGLDSLVDKSLLRQEAQPDGGVRFSMLETIREYGLEQLTARGELSITRRRHAAFFLALAERAEPNLKGLDQGVWLNRLETEHDNLRAALEWSLGSDDVELGLRLGAALREFWFVRGYWREGRAWLERALSQSGGTLPTWRAKALNQAGILAWHLGDYRRAQVLYGESLALSRELGDKERIAQVLHNLGYVAQEEGDAGRAVSLLKESVALFRELENKPGIAWSLNTLGELARSQIDYPHAAALYEESLTMFRELGDQKRIALLIHNLGYVAQYQRDYGRAGALFEESLALYRETADKKGIAGCLAGLAGVAGAQGRLELAARLFGAAEGLHANIGGHIHYADRAEYDRSVAAVRARLEEEAFRSAWTEGRVMAWEQVIEDALSVVRPSPTVTEAEALTGRRAIPLTPREQAVTALITRGLTNREIATALVITERTAGTHVQNILNKLGFNSRAQIAAWAVEHGLYTSSAD